MLSDCGRATVTTEGFFATNSHPDLKDVQITPAKDPEKSAREEAAWLRGLPYWSEETIVVAMLYDVHTGKVSVVG